MSETLHKPVETNAKWIWRDINTEKHDFVVFRRVFDLAGVPERAVAYVAAETKYWLYLNGRLVVFEGGLFRESVPGAGYADPVDLTPYLQPGRNTLAVLCWYYGNGGRNNVTLGHAGFLFACDALSLYSDERFDCLRHPAYYRPGEPLPSYLYGGDNIGFDANRDIGDFAAPDFDAGALVPATVYAPELYGPLNERPIPLHWRGELTPCREIRWTQGTYRARLPYAVQFCPCVQVNAAGGERISICSDRYTVPGGPGDDMHRYTGHRIEYICKPGENRFESLFYLYGEEIIVHTDKPVSLEKIEYYPTGYSTAIQGRFESTEPLLDTLVRKAARTLYVCMRDNFMDCPDRERGQWVGDVSVQIPQAMFLLDDRAKLLVRKSILDLIHLRQGDALVGNVPGDGPTELPGQSLNAISEWGLIAQYYKFTGDREILRFAFEPAVRYLQLWGVKENGLVEGRGGDWRWFDHLYNVDDEVLENAWYYSALHFQKRTAEILGDTRFDAFLNERMKGIESRFHDAFYKNGAYTSKGVVDDRANAMAVLSGLAPREVWPSLRPVLVSVSNASVYMENYVLTALCEMGYVQDAYRRMMSRYYNLAVNENSTLWEDFNLLGTKNHAWSGAPATIAFRYLLGVDTDDGKTYTISPCRGLLKGMRGRFTAMNGYIDVEVDENGEVRVENHSDSLVQLKK